MNEYMFLKTHGLSLDIDLIMGLDLGIGLDMNIILNMCIDVGLGICLDIINPNLYHNQKTPYLGIAVKCILEIRVFLQIKRQITTQSNSKIIYKPIYLKSMPNIQLNAFHCKQSCNWSANIYIYS